MRQTTRWTSVWCFFSINSYRAFKTLFFHFCKRNKLKRFLQRILQDLMKKNNTGKIRHLVDKSFVPSAQLTSSILYCWKIEVILLWNNLSCKVRVMAQFLNQCTHIDCNIEVNTRLSSKSQCTHMWLHWLLLSHIRKLNY